MATGNARDYDSLGDAGRNRTFDDGGNGVHGSHDLGLELRGNVKFDLLEQVFRSTEATHDEDVLRAG